MKDTRTDLDDEHAKEKKIDQCAEERRARARVGGTLAST
jgi:hypothetical protein